MADSGLSEIELRHKKERKELQGQIQKIKHEVPKGDKKRKREATEKIARLEAELDQRHEQELKEANQHEGQGDIEQSSVTERLETLTTEDDVAVAEQGSTSKKPSKAQKRREKKAALDRERNERIKEQMVLNLTGDRHLEYRKIKELLGEKGLQIYEIPSDGNCLYNAVSHQLKLRGTESSNESLRSQTADYMRKHQDDFMSFLSKENGDCFNSDDFAQYCTDLETTPAWGGQLEIQALSKTLQIPVDVIQAEGPAITTGEEFQGNPLILTYYRHAYGLGEHYHSVVEKTEEVEDEFT